MNSVENMCSECDKTCIECNGSTKYNCTKCKEKGAEIVNGQCKRTPCSVGTYYDITLLKCKKCLANCSICVGK